MIDKQVTDAPIFASEQHNHFANSKEPSFHQKTSWLVYLSFEVLNLSLRLDFFQFGIISFQALLRSLKHPA